MESTNCKNCKNCNCDKDKAHKLETSVTNKEDAEKVTEYMSKMLQLRTKLLVK